MPSNITSAIVFIVNAITSLYLLVLLLRFWLPWLQADFRNPLAQGILRLTSPVVIPVRRILPSFGRLDTATILVCFVIQYLTILLLLLIIGQAADFLTIAITTIVKLMVLVDQPVRLCDLHSRHPELDLSGRLQPGHGNYHHAYRACIAAFPAAFAADGRFRSLPDSRHHTFAGSNDRRQRVQAVRSVVAAIDWTAPAPVKHAAWQMNGL